MTQQSESDTSVPAGSGPATGESWDEFEDAVTTEISAAMARAYGSSSAGRDYSHVEVTDVELLAQPTPADSEPAEADVLKPGHILSQRFEIVELVHSGGMSHVYKAVDLRRHRSGSASKSQPETLQSEWLEGLIQDKRNRK